MSSRVSDHAARLVTSFGLMLAIILIAALFAALVEASPDDSWLIGAILFWPTMLLDRIFIPDPDYMDLGIMFASVFISTGSYTLVIYTVLLCLSKNQT